MSDSPDALDEASPYELGIEEAPDAGDPQLDRGSAIAPGSDAPVRTVRRGVPRRRAAPDPIMVSGRQVVPPSAGERPPEPEAHTAIDQSAPVSVSGAERPDTASEPSLVSGPYAAPVEESSRWRFPTITIDLFLTGCALALGAALLIGFAIILAPWPADWGVSIRLVLLAGDSLVLSVALLWVALDRQRRLHERAIAQREQAHGQKR